MDQLQNRMQVQDMHDCNFNNSLIIMTIQNRIAGRLQKKSRIDSDFVSAVAKIIFKIWRSDVIVIAMIKGEIIAMENRLHGCVFVIVIGGIDIIKPKTIERTECRYRY